MGTELVLDAAGLHRVVVDGDSVSLAYTGGDRTSRAHDAIAAALRVATAAGKTLVLDATTRRLYAGAGPLTISVALEDGTQLALGTVDGDAANSTYRLCPFELRYASDHGRLHPVPPDARSCEAPRTPVTDLHTHFAACVSGEGLLAIAEEHAIRYPASLLEAAGVRGGGDLLVSELPPSARERLARALEVPVERRVTFVDMERIYRLRGPVTKSEAALPAILRTLARDYAAMGVRYVELSLGSLVSARVLRAIHAHVPAIEDETGVTIRFLLALSRHDDLEWDLDLLRRVETLAGSVYVAGIDVMGHETCSTRAFVPQLTAFAAWASRARPGFVVRVHAGESPSHPENVRVAVETLAGHDVTIRIGHGLYGVDDETLDLLVRSRAFVELNLDSNVALNHLQSGRDLPLRRYVDAGARVLLGTDGYGIYGASSWTSARAALVVGLRHDHLRGPMRLAEEEAVARAAARDRAAIGERRTFVVPDDLAPFHFTLEVVTRRAAAEAARRAALGARIAEVGMTDVTRESFLELAAGRLVVAIGGAWKTSWDAMTEDERTRASDVLADFAAHLDPARVLLLTGGTRYGVEARLGAVALARGLLVVGALVEETSPDALASGHASHALVVAPTLYEKGARLYELVAELGGACFFVGGGQIVKDEILAAKNLGIPYVVLTEIGASGAHARERPSVAVRTGAEAAWFVTARGGPRTPAPHWYVGANPTVDAVVLRDREVLLVRRDPDAPVEAGAWALPGGFVGTRAPRGGAWEPGLESEEEACVRELREEAALVVRPEELVRIGIFEGGGRDPRDGARSWSRSTAFGVVLRGHAARAPIAGGDDAEDARWFALDALPPRLAFDHARILHEALAVLGAQGSGSPSGASSIG